MPTAEQLAREHIDHLLTAAGWAVQNVVAADIHAARGAAPRLSRLEAQLSDAERARVRSSTGGVELKDLSRAIVHALNPAADRSPQEAEDALRQAVRPLAKPQLRRLLLSLKAQKELVIDIVTQDRLLGAEYSEAARERAQALRQVVLARTFAPPGSSCAGQSEHVLTLT